MKRSFILIASISLALASGAWAADHSGPAPEGMVWIPGGEFTMGSPEKDKLARKVEQPAHKVTVSGFFIDVAEVTNAQFSEFVKATGYVTLAEKDIDWEELKKQVPPGTPKPPDEQLRAGSMVFTPPAKAVP